MIDKSFVSNLFVAEQQVAQLREKIRYKMNRIRDAVSRRQRSNKSSVYGDDWNDPAELVYRVTGEDNISAIVVTRYDRGYGETGKEETHFYLTTEDLNHPSLEGDVSIDRLIKEHPLFKRI